MARSSGAGVTVANPTRALQRGVDAGILPLQGTKGREGTSDPHTRAAGVYPQGRERCVYRRNRCWKDGLDGLSRPQSRSEWLSSVVYRGTGPVRRHVLLSRGSIHSQAFAFTGQRGCRSEERRVGKEGG